MRAHGMQNTRASPGLCSYTQEEAFVYMQMVLSYSEIPGCKQGMQTDNDREARSLVPLLTAREATTGLTLQPGGTHRRGTCQW